MPPSPERGCGAAGEPEGALLARLQELLSVAGLLTARHGGQVAFQAAEGGGLHGRRHADTRHQQEQPAERAPRPYFWRLQQRLAAGGYRPTADGGGAAAAEGGAGLAPDDAAMLFRREVYEQVGLAELVGSQAREAPRPGFWPSVWQGPNSAPMLALPIRVCMRCL